MPLSPPCLNIFIILSFEIKSFLRSLQRLIQNAINGYFFKLYLLLFFRPVCPAFLCNEDGPTTIYPQSCNGQRELIQRWQPLCRLGCCSWCIPHAHAGFVHQVQSQDPKSCCPVGTSGVLGMGRRRLTRTAVVEAA